MTIQLFLAYIWVVVGSVSVCVLVLKNRRIEKEKKWAQNGFLLFELNGGGSAGSLEIIGLLEFNHCSGYKTKFFSASEYQESVLRSYFECHGWREKNKGDSRIWLKEDPEFWKYVHVFKVKDGKIQDKDRSFSFHPLILEQDKI